MLSPSWGHRCCSLSTPSPGLCFTCLPALRWGASACPAQGSRFAQRWTLRAPVLTIVHTLRGCPIPTSWADGLRLCFQAWLHCPSLHIT